MEILLFTMGMMSFLLIRENIGCVELLTQI